VSYESCLYKVHCTWLAYVNKTPIDHLCPCECDNNDVTVTSFERLEMVNNQIFHRFFVNSKLGDIRSDECIIFSDGQRSEGCARDEFHSYVSAVSVQSTPDGSFFKLYVMSCDLHSCTVTLSC